VTLVAVGPGAIGATVAAVVPTPVNDVLAVVR
jgi:hypothetical protein